MKRLFAAIICLSLSIAAFAQSPISLIQFMNDFDWSWTPSDFKARYGDNVTAAADSIVVSNVVADDTAFSISIGLEKANYTPVGFSAQVAGGSYDSFLAILTEEYGKPEKSEDPDGPGGVFWMGDKIFLALTPQVYGCGIACMSMELLTNAISSLFDTEPKEHLQFKGIPIDGTPDEFVKQLKSKGFTYVTTYNGTPFLEGSFAGYNNVQLLVMAKYNLVGSVTLYFKVGDSWSGAKTAYNNLKSSLRIKYDVEPEVKEYFPSYPFEGSGLEYMAFNDEKAEYKSTFNLDNGKIVLFIVHFKNESEFKLGMIYYDSQNMKKQIEGVIDDL